MLGVIELKNLLGACAHPKPTQCHDEYKRIIKLQHLHCLSRVHDHKIMHQPLPATAVLGMSLFTGKFAN